MSLWWEIISSVCVSGFRDGVGGSIGDMGWTSKSISIAISVSIWEGVLGLRGDGSTCVEYVVEITFSRGGGSIWVV